MDTPIGVTVTTLTNNTRGDYMEDLPMRTFTIFVQAGCIKAGWLTPRHIGSLLAESCQEVTHAEDFLAYREDGQDVLFKPETVGQIVELGEDYNIFALNWGTIERLVNLYQQGHN